MSTSRKSTINEHKLWYECQKTGLGSGEGGLVCIYI